MLETVLRGGIDRFLILPLVRCLKTITWLRPHHITALALVSGCVSAYCVATGHPYLGLGWLLFSGYLDILDGAFARGIGADGVFGALTDIMSDRVVEFSTVLGLFWVSPEARGFYCVVMLGAILLTVTAFLTAAVYGQKETDGKSLFYSRALVERAEAFVFFGLMIIAPSYFGILAVTFSGLLFFSAGQHFLSFSAIHRREARFPKP